MKRRKKRREQQASCSIVLPPARCMAACDGAIGRFWCTSWARGPGMKAFNAGAPSPASFHADGAEWRTNSPLRGRGSEISLVGPGFISGIC